VYVCVRACLRTHILCTVCVCVCVHVYVWVWVCVCVCMCVCTCVCMCVCVCTCVRAHTHIVYIHSISKYPIDCSSDLACVCVCVCMCIRACVCVRTHARVVYMYSFINTLRTATASWSVSVKSATRTTKSSWVTRLTHQRHDSLIGEMMNEWDDSLTRDMTHSSWMSDTTHTSGTWLVHRRHDSSFASLMNELCF